MSIVIVGGNERMERRYKDLCREYNYDVKVFTKMKYGLKDRIGSPDLLVIFTNTTSHKMLEMALDRIKGTETVIARSHSSSMSALRDILDMYTCTNSIPCLKSSL